MTNWRLVLIPAALAMLARNAKVYVKWRDPASSTEEFATSGCAEPLRYLVADDLSPTAVLDNFWIRRTAHLNIQRRYTAA